jgi:hypothetical protein
VHIEFVHSGPWRSIWSAAALACCLVAGLTAWKWHYLTDAIKLQRLQIADIASELQRLRTPVEVKADPRSGSVALAQVQVLRDLNPLFVAIENTKVSGAHLKEFVVDTVGNTMRLDYEIDSLEMAAQVTEALNVGNEQRPWRLGTVAVVSSSGAPKVANQAMEGRAGPVVFRASWMVSLRSL